MNVIVRTTCVDRLGEGTYEARLLHEFGSTDGYLNPAKVRELWLNLKKHDVLFSDYTAGKIEPFLEVLMNPNGVWLEFYRLGHGPVGIGYLSRVIPKFDAYGHFAFWDSIASGRQPLVWGVLDWMFNRYKLHRISGAVPVYQSGTLRFVERLGLKREGIRREAVLHKGFWMDMVELGILYSEFNEIYSKFLADRREKNV